MPKHRTGGGWVMVAQCRGRCGGKPGYLIAAGWRMAALRGRDGWMTQL
jgi:hypothetical protein